MSGPPAASWGRPTWPTSAPGVVLAVLFVFAPGPAAGQIRFQEVSATWGIDFRHHHGGTGRLYMPETMGSGVVIFDYDADGDDDLFFVDSGPMPGYEGEPTGSKLFRNDGGHFSDVTAASGLEVTSYGMGGVAGDIDGDGDLDLYVTAFGPNQLFVNRGDGTFTDRTAASGADDALFSAGAALADVDLDGDLDLYVVNYVDFSFENNPSCGRRDRGVPSYCHPDVFEGEPDTLYRNRGDGTFEVATAVAGLSGATGTGLGALFFDPDRDGWPDLYVANDMRPNFLFRNRGNGTFEDISLLSGTSLNDRGNPEASMGVEVGDLDGSGEPEIMTTHLDAETNALYSHLGSWLFVDRRYVSKLAEPSVNKVGFGVVFGDLDADGYLDVVVANGHILDNVEVWDPVITYKQPNQLFRNLGDGRFEELTSAGLDLVRSSRGLAAGDLDGDGDLDLVVSNSNDRAEAWENVTAPSGRWLAVSVTDSAGAPQVGSRIEMRVGTEAHWRETRAGSSYLSQSSATARFGAGAAAGPADLDVKWPGGGRRVYRRLALDRRYRLSPIP